jgi:hypothetical protein
MGAEEEKSLAAKTAEAAKEGETAVKCACERRSLSVIFDRAVRQQVNHADPWAEFGL